MAGFAGKCEGIRDGGVGGGGGCGVGVYVCFFPSPKLLMTLVFVQSKHRPTPNKTKPSNPAYTPTTTTPNKRAFQIAVTLLFVLNGSHVKFLDKSSYFNS